MDRRTFLSALAAAGALAPLPARADLPTLKFRDLYSRGRELSDISTGFEGQRIGMLGYMAPPLKPEVKFFVLTRLPMATCPFCNDASDWPTDLVLAYSDSPLSIVRFSDLIRVEGTFETGFVTDPDTGFVSFVRLRDIAYTRI